MGRQSAGRWGVLASIAAALMAGGAGCSGDDAGGDVVVGAVDFEPTAQFLTDASRRTSASAYRVDMAMDMHVARDGDELSLDAPVMAGELDGDRYRYVIDMEEFLNQMAAGEDEPLPVLRDYTIEVVGDGDTLYVRTPFIAAIADVARPGRDLGARGELVELGDRWGRVDLRQLGDVSLAELQQLLGAPIDAELDPRLVLDLVAGADDVEELGTDVVGGVGVNGLGAEVPLADLLEAEGTDPEEYVDEVAARDIGGLDAELRAAVAERALESEASYEVWVDGDGYVRRIALEVDVTEILGWALTMATGLDEYTVGGTVDYADYGDRSIAIELPADAVDATPMVSRALDAG